MTAESLSLAGKVAIVTGSGRENGIGAAIAKALARNGAAVTINYVSETSAPRAAKLVEAIESEGGRAVSIRADVTIPEEAASLVTGTLTAFKAQKLDILVNNAGTGYVHSTLDLPLADIEKFFQINVFGTIYLTRAAVPHMGRGGRIINITSIGSKLGLESLPIYGATKAAVDSLSYAWAREFGASKGITVNSVAPGTVLTDLVKIEDAETAYASLLDLVRAERRFGTPEDIADIVLLVAQEKSRWLTGQYISASGGSTGQ